MGPYLLVLRDEDAGTTRGRVRQAIRAVLSVGTQGLVSPVGRSALDVVSASSNAVVARWDDPPRADGSTGWMPVLQAELDDIGLEAFAEKYGLRLLPS